LFKNALEGKGQPSLPWSISNPNHVHFFWLYYREGKNSPMEAFRRLVPFRGSSPARITAPWLPGKAILESFHYPHGIALVATVLIKADLSLDLMVEKALEIAHTGKWKVTWPDNSIAEHGMLQLGPHTLDRLRKSTFGNDVEQGTRSLKPFTIVTVVRGSGVDKTQANTHNDPVHLALEALCNWRSTWKDDEPHPLAERTIPIRNASPSHVLYGLTSGRAVWFPAQFTKSGIKSSLGCYHRNLMFASLQTESLARFMVLAYDRLQNAPTANPISPSMDKLVTSAAGILGRLYGGNRDTYSSFSPSVQIEDNGWAKPINYVRNFIGEMAPLHKKRA
jgi:hypothetical protein